MLTITKDIYKVAKFASTNNSNPILSSIKISEHGMVGTDSYKLIMIKNKGLDITDFPIIDNINKNNENKVVKSINEPLLLKAKDILAKLKFPTKQALPILETGLLCHETKTSVSIATTDSETDSILQFKKIIGHYPDYIRIIPTQEPIATIKINSKLMIECLEAFIYDKNISSVELNLYGKGNPIVITGCDDENKHIKTLLMPKK